MSGSECEPLLPHELPEEIERPAVRIESARGRAGRVRGGSIYGPSAGWPWAVLASLLYLLMSVAMPMLGTLAPVTSRFSAATLVLFFIVGASLATGLLVAIFWAINAASLRLLHSRVMERIAAACRASSQEDLAGLRYAGVRYDARQRAWLGGGLHDIGFIEIRPEELVFIGPMVSWAIHRDWVQRVCLCPRKGDLNAPPPRWGRPDLPLPVVVYRPPYGHDPLVVSVIVCDRPLRKAIAEDSMRLYRELVDWAAP